MRNADTLELTSPGGAHTQTVWILRGSFQPHEGCISVKRADSEDGAREFVPWWALERVRHIDRSRVDQ